MKLHTRVIAAMLLIASVCPGQVPQLPPASASEHVDEAKEWLKTKSYHVAREELEKSLSRTTVSARDQDVLFLLMKSTYEDHDYEESYQWSTEYLLDYPADAARSTALFIQGVSAFQLEQIDDARKSLTRLLDEEPDYPERGVAYFWRAMAEVERGDWEGVEADLQRAYDEPTAFEYRDNVLMGWALALERRGEYSRSAEYIERLLRDHPNSKLVTDARIRLASLALRRRSPSQALEILGQVRPETPQQREEYLLLKAEADFQSDHFADAKNGYEQLLRQFSDSRYARVAELGLAWSHLKQGNYPAAQQVFDSLSVRRKDSIAYAALYQSGVLSLLQKNTVTALAKFDTLTNVSPYDEYAERAYYQMGMINYRAHRYREARRNFQLAARLFPESRNRANAYRMMGEANMAVNDFANAQFAFSQVRRLGAPSDMLADALFQESVSLYHLGRFKSSAESFGEYLRRFPSHGRIAEGYVWRAEALYQDGRYSEAERSYGEALRLFPNNTKREDAAYGLAWTLFEQKKFSQAAAAFDRFTNDYPQSDRVVDANLRKADSYFFMGQYDKSSSLYASLAETRKGSRYTEYAAFQLAMSYIQRGDADRGIEHLRNFLVKYPQSIYNEVVQFNIGWTYFSREQYAEALRELRLVLQQYPQSQLMPRVLFNIGDAFYNLKQNDSARIYYQRVVREYPTSPLVPDAMSGLQFAYEAEGRPQAALAEIDSFVQQAPAGASQDELLIRKGDILFNQGDFGGAVSEYQKLLARKPGRPIHARVLYQLGRAYEQEDNLQQAISYYEQVSTSFSDTEDAPAVTLALGIAYMKTKRYKEAAASLQDFEKKYPDSPLISEVRYNRAVATLNIPDQRSAMDQFRSVVQLHPGDVFADRSRLQIGKMLTAQRQYAAAFDTLNGVVTRRSDDVAAEALLLVGENYMAMKRSKDALQAFKDVYEQYTEFPLIVERARLGAGDVFARLKDTKQARTMYEEVVRNAVDPAVRKDAEDRLRRLR